ncbi:MAG: hypothetical protein RIF41_07545, partial [Polyangiaceae bacterium]
ADMVEDGRRAIAAVREDIERAAREDERARFCDGLASALVRAGVDPEDAETIAFGARLREGGRDA